MVGQRLVDALAVHVEGEITRSSRHLKFEESRQTRIGVILDDAAVGIKDTAVIGDASVLFHDFREDFLQHAHLGGELVVP